ncbi:MAG TPA: MFS transporter [Stellaceae bacterium]|nr:MFS transporter [Stellaceae bacterium]
MSVHPLARGGDRSIARPFTCYALLWLSGVALRLTVLAVPPVVPRLHADLHLSETEIGMLSSVVSLLFAVAALPGSLLIARFGAVPTLIVGLLLNAAGSAARAAVPNAALLYAATIVMGCGVALMQPALPPLVRAWLPRRIGFGTALYSNGLLAGEVLVVALTIPVILPLTGGSWRWNFILWTLPIIATLLLVAVLAPRPPAAPGAAPRLWWPDWRRPFIWRLGLILGCVNSTYFATNHFLPDYLTAAGSPQLIGAALTALNFMQLPASVLMLVFAGRLALQRWAYVGTGGLALLSILGIVATPGAWVVVWAGTLGFALAAALILGLAVPALVSKAEDVHRTSAGMFAISYTVAVLTPILGGLLWDATGLPLAGFAPIGLCAIAVAAIAATTEFRGEER